MNKRQKKKQLKKQVRNLLSQFVFECTKNTKTFSLSVETEERYYMDRNEICETLKDYPEAYGLAYGPWTLIDKKEVSPEGISSIVEPTGCPGDDC